LHLATTSIELLGIEGGESPEGPTLPALADNQGDLSTQAVLPNTSGYAYYLSHIPGTRTPPTPSSYGIYRHNQQTDVVTLLYSGNRQIQSVAGSGNGSVVVFSMRETTESSSDYEIFRVTFSDTSGAALFRLTADTVDNTNVSMSGDIYRFVYEEPIAGIASVIIRNYLPAFPAYDRVVLSQTVPQRQPSLSSSGRYIALVRDLANGTDRVLSYNIHTNTYLTISTSTAVLEYPSISELVPEQKVMWLRNGSPDNLLVKSLASNTIQTVAAGSSLNHPHLTADGAFITYQSGNTIVTKNLTTAQVVTIASSLSFSYYAPMWQVILETDLGLGGYSRSVSIRGDLLVVGLSEVARLYQRNSLGGWDLVKELRASDGAADDDFGASVAIDASGNTVVVGAPYESHDTDGNGTDESAVGAAYLFQKDQGGTNNWGQIKKLIASDGAANDRFGFSVAISGRTVIVGADGEDHNPSNGDDVVQCGAFSTACDVGAAYIFSTHQGGISNWGQVKKLIPAGRSRFFGASVAISDRTVVVGADAESNQTNHGAAYIFSQDQGGAGNWGQVKRLVGDTSEGLSNFGWSVAISSNIVVVGAPYGDTAHIFQKDQGGANNWGQAKKLIASDGAEGDHFGLSVAIDGNRVVVGAPFEAHDTNSDGRVDCDSEADEECFVGAAYVFQQDLGGANNWGQVRKLMDSDGANYDGSEFGWSVAISGSTIAVAGSRGPHIYE
jgi:hypothetical protein